MNEYPTPEDVFDFAWKPGKTGIWVRQETWENIHRGWSNLWVPNPKDGPSVGQILIQGVRVGWLSDALLKREGIE